MGWGIERTQIPGYIAFTVEKLRQARWVRKGMWVIAGAVLIGAIVPLQAALPNFHTFALDSPPEPAAFTLIGTGLCLLSLRLRSRK